MMEEIADQAWSLLLARAIRKRATLRAEMGDEVDLFVPQSRLLSLTQSRPDMARLLYLSAQAAARRNASNIVRKLGMPQDYFWKFEFWPRGRAFTTLEKIVAKVFSSMMTEAKEGNPRITDLDIDPLRVGIGFAECVECAGFSGLNQGVCFYHAGAFSGIVSGLINRDLDAFETECHASGHELCRFVLGDRADESVKGRFETFISHRELGINLDSRVQDCLSELPARSSMGNRVDVNYLQLAMASALVTDPKLLSAASFEVGLQLGRTFARAIAGSLSGNGLGNIGAFHSRLGECRLDVRQTGPHLEVTVRECAETAGNRSATEMMSFTFGELQGLASELAKMEMVLHESRFEGDKLVLTFTPKPQG